MVDRTAISPALLRQSVLDSLERGGWRNGSTAQQFDEIVDEHVEAIIRICRAFGEGAVIRRDGPAFWADIKRSAA